MTDTNSTAFSTPADTGRNLHTPAERMEGESWEDYKSRRRSFNRKRKDYSRGTMVRLGTRQEPVLFNGKQIKNAKGKIITETKGNPPFVGKVEHLIKGQA